jgi:site-specific DNA-cytosine methylase
MERALELTVWSDCSGINSEMFALREIRTALEHSIGVSVQFKLYFTCDSDKKCFKFANLNHHPKHTSTAMEQRNFETGKIWCETHKENHDLPKQGVDLYVGTYPCSPWSRRGKRTGFDHPDAQAFFIGLRTIVFLAPAVWIIEIGEVPSTAGMTEITQRVQEVIHNGRVTYTIQTVQSLSPAWCGYPVRRTRLFICGWRQEIGTDTVTEPLK